MAVVAKKFEATPGSVFSTAFNGEAAGTDKLALPYVRWTSDTRYNDGTGQRQRTFIAVTNVGDAAIGPVTVRYIDRAGATIGTHTIATIAAKGKAPSTPSPTADGGPTTPTTPADEAKLRFFGSPEHYGSQTFGGSAIVEGPAGAQLIVIASVASKTDKQVQEDYNGIPVD
jgi:hypothetical protein